MKIMFYINKISDGGAERVMSNLCNEFIKRNYEIILVTSFKTDNEYQLDCKIKRYCLDKENIKTNFIKRNYTRIKGLRKLCKKLKPNVLISFMAEPNFRSILATMFLVL